jgi:TnpA family transposase
VLTKPIDWELVRQQYDQMVKYTTALRLGTAETEAILRRFTRDNIHLHSEELRREINEGLNVTEQWNGANDFVFFARRGELVSNRREDHEVSMLSLQPKWANKLTPRDLRALTPLIWDHVNPYGRFELGMNDRLPLE